MGQQGKRDMRIDLWTKDMPVDEMKIFFTKLWWPCLKLLNVRQMTKKADTMKRFL
jgi:hypothetical protein